MKLRIEKSVYGGSGLARADGKAIFVPFTLPGEEVEADVVSDKGGFATAELQSIVESSPTRAQPPCPYFGQCGGCHYQHAAYPAQAEIKLAILRESLERARIKDIPVIIPITAEPLGYRNRIRLHIQENPFALCYKVRKSHANLPIATCPIAAPALQRAIEILNREGASLGLAPFVTELELFTSPGESPLLLSLWTNQPAAAAKPCFDKVSPQLRQILPEVHGIGLFATERNRTTNRLLARSGEEFLTYPSTAHRYRVGLGSFFQVNRFLIDPLVRLVTDGEQGSIAWDLYAGVGLFSLPLAAQFAEVTAVESSPSAVRDLRENLRGTQHRIVAADTAAFLHQAVQHRYPVPDLVVLDPPRAGLDKEVTAALGKIRPRKITYVSCDPSTLSRDLAALVESGYRLRNMHLLDLFPQTYHLESVTHLSLD
ncbi:MAG TPA: 23S rRNA (uracil(1939)-C(5))-methyltransferase RlmD [Acidobacteriaceae bacterium]|jgi:23S rRNA (uracil1939-C5)-methyltransferase|nr:23S rRNA (uracil(1939)-C(5))-methyltransferase RlmD [Acidobacteriaceae bacterium]